MGRGLRVGIVGHRSWLAQHFRDELVRRDFYVDDIPKGSAGGTDLRRYSAVILIAGRARPTADEMLAEERLVRSVCDNPFQPGRLVYVSSGAVDRWERGSRPLSLSGEVYVLGKKRCETLVCGKPEGQRRAPGYVLRLPVVFGPGQSLDSDMLVPSTIRARLCHGIVDLRRPMDQFELVAVWDAARALADLVQDHDPWPVRSVRSDPWQPLRIVSMVAPGIPVMIGEGWEWRDLGRPEPGQRHLTEVTYPLRQVDLDSTVAWYEKNSMTLVDGIRGRTEARLELSRSLALPSGKEIIDL